MFGRDVVHVLGHQGHEQVAVGCGVIIFKEPLGEALEVSGGAGGAVGILTEQARCVGGNAVGKQHQVASNQPRFQGIDLTFHCGVGVVVVLFEQSKGLAIGRLAVGVL